MTCKDANLNGWRLSRYFVKQARMRLVKEGDPAAAEQLLRHSIAYRHNSLIVQRYLIARGLGVATLASYDRYYKNAKKEMNEERLKKARTLADRSLRSIRKLRSSSPQVASGE